MTAAEVAYALIAVFEGEHLRAYQYSGGVWTIGLGHTQGVGRGMTITSTQALELFRLDAQPLWPLVQYMPPLRAGAYVSFGYNCGRTALQNVLAGADSILNPKHAMDRHGATQSGLVARRRLEALLAGA